MLYRDISLVSIFGLHGTLYVQKAESAEGVSVQTEGPYEAKVVDGSWLIIHPEGQEPPITRPFVFRRSHTDITAPGMQLGSVDVAAKVQFLTGSGLRRIRARASARAQATVRVTAPLSTKFELTRCYGVCKGPRGWHLMRGDSRFDTRWTRINEAPPARGIS
jgi:hypothetical protein